MNKLYGRTVSLPLLFACAAWALVPAGGCSSSSNDSSNGGDTGTGGGSGGAKTGSGGRGGSGSGGSGSGGSATGGAQGGTGAGGTGGGPAAGGEMGTDAGAGGADASPGGTDGPVIQVGGGTFCPAGNFTLQLPANPKATLVKAGLRGAEGPVWVESESALFFSEIHRADGDFTMPTSTTISKLVGKDVTEWVAASGSNGLALIKVGGKWALLAAAHDKEELSIYDVATKARTSYVGQYMGKAFNSPNDLAVRSDGTVYFSDPDWQAAKRPGQGATRVYRVAAADRAVSVVDAALMQPNGVSLSPDEKYLYVGSIMTGGAGVLTRYEVNADGSTKPGTMFKKTVGMYPDGMTFDCAGNLYVATSMGIEVYASAQDAGKVIAVGTNLGASNVAFGGADHKTLYITSETDADKAIYSITLNVPGLPY